MERGKPVQLRWTDRSGRLFEPNMYFSVERADDFYYDLIDAADTRRAEVFRRVKGREQTLRCWPRRAEHRAGGARR